MGPSDAGFDVGTTLKLGGAVSGSMEDAVFGAVGGAVSFCRFDVGTTLTLGGAVSGSMGDAVFGAVGGAVSFCRRRCSITSQ